MDGLIWWCWTIWDWTQDVVTTPRTQSKILGALILLSDSDFCSLKKCPWICFIFDWLLSLLPSCDFHLLSRAASSLCGPPCRLGPCFCIPWQCDDAWDTKKDRQTSVPSTHFLMLDRGRALTGRGLCDALEAGQGGKRPGEDEPCEKAQGLRGGALPGAGTGGRNSETGEV